MKILGIVGPSGSGTTAAVERVVSRLSERGSVATVTHAEGDALTDGADAVGTPTADAAEAHWVAEDGSWVAVGEDRTLDDALATLAPQYDYAVVEGYPDATLPTVALSDAEHEGETVTTAPDPQSVDLAAVVDAVEEQDDFETLESLVAAVKRSPDSEYSGAIATFTGRVRTKNGPEDTPTEFLEFERYDGVAEEKMAAIKSDLEAREGIYEVLLHHRTGVVRREEDIVFVVVLAGHRSEAFETVEDGINRLKAEVPLFKKEVTVDGEFWAHEPDLVD